MVLGRHLEGDQGIEMKGTGSASDYGTRCRVRCSKLRAVTGCRGYRVDFGIDQGTSLCRNKKSKKGQWEFVKHLRWGTKSRCAHTVEQTVECAEIPPLAPVQTSATNGFFPTLELGNLAKQFYNLFL